MGYYNSIHGHQGLLLNPKAAKVCLVVTTLFLMNSQSPVLAGTTSRLGKCEQIQVPMCKGLVRYNMTQLPNKFGHKTQTEVYWAMQPWWPFVDAGCSNNLRAFVCGLYLPQCVGGTNEPLYPCMETCRKAKVRCVKQMRREKMSWAPELQCGRFLPKSSRRCIPPQRERRKNKHKQYVLCQRNKLSMCQDIPFLQGSLPNMFLQGNLDEIEREMRQFQPLIDSGCSKKLRLFMCGAYMPFCVPGTKEGEDGVTKSKDGRRFLIAGRQPDVPFVVPCRELCQEVYDQCGGEYEQRTSGLPWPGKFHCNRYPSYVDQYDSNGWNGTRSRSSGSSVPCTMPPFSYDGN